MASFLTKIGVLPWLQSCFWLSGGNLLLFLIQQVVSRDFFQMLERLLTNFCWSAVQGSRTKGWLNQCTILQAVQSQQEAELDIALSKLEQSRVMVAISCFSCSYFIIQTS
jgi:hypothetical protein